MDRNIKNREHLPQGVFVRALLVAFLILSLSGHNIYSKDPLQTKWQKELVKLYDTVSITFIGDIMQHGSQISSALIPGEDPSKGDSYNYSSTFEHIAPRLESADIAVANMEFTLGTPPYSGYPQFSAPKAIATEAKESGIDLFLLANNHILDKGESGLRKSLNIYDSLGVPYTGVYSDSCSEAINNPTIMECKGVKIAFINFTYGTNGFSTPDPYIVNRMDSVNVKEAIARAKERGAQMIIALPHWGYEYQLQPNGEQRRWASMLFREGVKVIVGSHPHVPQSAEIYLAESLHPRRYGEVEKMVFYSLGNYISNQSNPEYTQMGMLVNILIIKNNLNGEITLSRPGWEYIWCFRRGEIGKDYTVVPIKDFMKWVDENSSGITDNPLKIKNSTHYRRMVNTFEYIRNLKPVTFK
ncbi:MAG: CapA family protein [Bacteroidales bacterium]|nr:CapA family protein [Bacteroidales bacterium]